MEILWDLSLVLEIDSLLSIFIMMSISAEMVEGFRLWQSLAQNTISDVSIAPWLLYTIYCCVRLPLLNLATRNVIIFVTFLEYNDNLLF